MTHLNLIRTYKHIYDCEEVIYLYCILLHKAQLALPLSHLPQKAIIFAMKSVMYTHTHEQTPTIIEIDFGYTEGSWYLVPSIKQSCLSKTSMDIEIMANMAGHIINYNWSQCLMFNME